MNNINSIFISNVWKAFLRLLALTLSLCLILGLCGCTNKPKTTYDFSTYLSDGTDFCKNASKVLPSKEYLSDTNIVYYLYYYTGKDEDSLLSSRLIYLTVAYSDEKFAVESQRLEYILKEKFPNDTSSSQFYLNGVLFKGIEFQYEHGLACHICSDSNTISYIAFRTVDLQYMDVKYAIEDCLPSDAKYQITPY